MNIAANGSCTVRAYDPPSQSCVVKEVQQRGVRSAKIVPTGGVGWNMYPATGYPQTFDTRVDPVKNPPGYATWVPLTLGTRELTFSGTAYQTNCFLTPAEWFDPNNPLTLHVVNCAPKFISPGTGGTKPRHMPPGPVDIYFHPSALQNVVEAYLQARHDWNLVQSGVTFQIVSQPCAANNCITVTTDDIGSLCALSTIPQADADGEFNSSMITYLALGAASWNADVLRRYANHELAHALGLDDHATCPVNKGLMGFTSTCNQLFGFAETPNVTDYNPVIETVYGSNGTATCPLPPQ